jgi:hypothetical protein
VRIRSVLCGALVLAAVAGCAGPGASGPAAQPAAQPAWTEPADYKFTVESSCGGQPLIGLFRVTVSDGAVIKSEGLDTAARRALMLRIAHLVPTLQQMVDQAEQARDGGAAVTLERDPADGHPVAVRIDESKDAIDDETCYTISGYTIGGKPGPSVSPSR